MKDNAMMMKYTEVSDEVQRLIDRGLKTPNLKVKMIPHDKIIVTSGKHQVRSMNVGIDETLTYQIENMGLMNPVVLMPYGDTGKYIPVSGHTRIKSVMQIVKNTTSIARTWGFEHAIPAFVYDEEITDELEFNAVANVLNDHQKSNPLTRRDLVNSLINFMQDGKFNDDAGNVDADKPLKYLYSMQLSNFTKGELSGMVEKAMNRVLKDVRLTDFVDGSVKTYVNKQKENGRLFPHFDISTNKTSEHYIEKDDGVLANFIRGIKPGHQQWVIEHLASFATYVRKLAVNDIVASERIIYWHVTDIIEGSVEMTAHETLIETRKSIVKMTRDLMLILEEQYRPTKIAFVPQFQKKVDEKGNEVMGEEVTYYEV